MKSSVLLQSDQHKVERTVKTAHAHIIIHVCSNKYSLYHGGECHVCMHTCIVLHERRHAITKLLCGAACPSLLPSLTMGEINLLVSQMSAF